MFETPKPASALPENVGWPPVIVAPLAGLARLTWGVAAASEIESVALVSRRNSALQGQQGQTPRPRA